METSTTVNHIAFIMDGNRRWAKQHNLPIAAGHRKGAETLTDIAKAAKELGVRYMTVYAFSTENWGRKKEEVDTLMDLLRHYLDKGFKELKENDARIIFIGERYMLADDIRQKMAQIEQETAQNKAVTLCVALSYGGRQEIVSAVNKLLREGKTQITEQDISDNIYTVPECDLIIRPSGEERLSNFLLWQAAYSEFWYSDVLWPDFTNEDLYSALREFEKRNRRFGG